MAFKGLDTHSRVFAVSKQTVYCKKLLVFIFYFFVLCLLA